VVNSSSTSSLHGALAQSCAASTECHWHDAQHHQGLMREYIHSVCGPEPGIVLAPMHSTCTHICTTQAALMPGQSIRSLVAGQVAVQRLVLAEMLWPGCRGPALAFRHGQQSCQGCLVSQLSALRPLSASHLHRILDSEQNQHITCFSVDLTAGTGQHSDTTRVVPIVMALPEPQTPSTSVQHQSSRSTYKHY